MITLKELDDAIAQAEAAVTEAETQLADRHNEYEALQVERTNLILAAFCEKHGCTLRLGDHLLGTQSFQNLKALHISPSDARRFAWIGREWCISGFNDAVFYVVSGNEGTGNVPLDIIIDMRREYLSRLS